MYICILNDLCLFITKVLVFFRYFCFYLSFCCRTTKHLVFFWNLYYWAKNKKKIKFLALIICKIKVSSYFNKIVKYSYIQKDPIFAKAGVAKHGLAEKVPAEIFNEKLSRLQSSIFAQSYRVIWQKNGVFWHKVVKINVKYFGARISIYLAQSCQDNNQVF